LWNAPIEHDYERKLAFLQGRAIALWDVVGSCHRVGSSDSDITDEKVNDFNNLFSTFPNIKAVFFNGIKSFEVFRKRVGLNVLEERFYKKLPSTSPANNTVKFEEKFKEWSILLKYL